MANPLITGPSSSASPYLLGSEPNVRFAAITTVGDSIGVKPDSSPYRFVGIPDGIGAFDNGNGTITVLVNHELGATAGIVRAHGSRGAFVSRLIVDKSDLSVDAASDLIQTVYLWNGTGYTAGTTAFARFCSGDLADPSAFYDAASGLGTRARIYLNGEETGAEGRAFAHILTGDAAGSSYQLALFGRTSYENSVANSHTGVKTVVLSTDDSTPGQVYVYVGTKTDTGTDVDKAGLTNGNLYGIVASGIGNNAASESALAGATPTSGTFSLAQIASPESKTGAQIETASDAAGVSEFWRPEDIAWDPTNANVAYFVTTANFSGLSKLYKLTFTDAANPTLGGSYEVLLDGTEGQRMMDNIAVGTDGKVYIQEDVGGNDRTGRVWVYDPSNDKLTEVARHDVARFGAEGVPATAPFNNDEESSGIIDATALLGYTGGKAFLLDVQAHYSLGGELVEGGQLVAMYVDDVRNGGAGNDRVAGDATDNFALNGFAGNDTLLGGSGNDGLLGGRGGDRLDGGRGNDVLQGGLDADQFLFFTSVNNSLQASNGDVDIVTDFSFAQGDSFDFGGASVTGARVSFLAATGTLNGIALDNSARGLDLEVTLSRNGVTQKVVFLDAYGFGSNAAWEAALGIDLTYPRPLPAGSDFVAIA